ncbi:MAG: CrcB family protein [Actinobacteria bacterium]|nr:CrcB family protein [Actinomycetota bacterium]
MQILLVALGGILGSLLRWQLIEVLPTLSFGVFLVNQLGVFVAGYVAFRMKTTISQRTFWITGFAGGFTTLSSLAFILHESNIASGLIYASISLATSIIILHLLKGKAKS